MKPFMHLHQIEQEQRDNKPLNILVGCEESQAVTIELRKLGHNAFSCDIDECSGGHPEWHLQMDIFEAIERRKWDVGIFFPPCTFLTGAGSRWLKDQAPLKSGKLVGADRRKAQREAIGFFMALVNADIPRIAIENPKGVMSRMYRKPDQIIQPWQFGHGEMKATCLWLKGLPKLTPTKIVKGRKQNIIAMPPSPERSKLRSKTYSGVAKAIALQWSEYAQSNPV